MDQRNTPHLQLAMFNQQHTFLPELQDLIRQDLSSLFVKQAKRQAIVEDMKKQFYESFESYMETEEEIQQVIKNALDGELLCQTEWMEDCLCNLNVISRVPKDSKEITEARLRYFGDFVVDDLWKEALLSLQRN